MVAGEERSCRRRCTPSEFSSGRVARHRFADDAAQGLFPLRSLAFDVFAQSGVDQRLVAHFAARAVGDSGKMIYLVLVQADGDAHFARLHWRFSRDASAAALGEIILWLHLEDLLSRLSR